MFFFIKQKTAYEMRISDWSSDVCSSDLRGPDSSRSARRQARDGIPRTFRRIGRLRPTSAAWMQDPPAARCHAHEPRSNGREGFRSPHRREDRKRDVEGKSVKVRVDLGGRRHIKKKQRTKYIRIKTDKHKRKKTQKTNKTR